MLDFSPILVLQIKIGIKPERHCKGSYKIWETLSFWRNFFNNGAIWLQTLICNRLNPRYEMQAVWLSIQRNHPFAYERLFLWRLMYWGCNYSFDEPSLASSDTGKTYDFNTADKLNTLLLNCLLSTGQLKEGEGYDVDFDHQFIEAEKFDAKPTYKKFLGYRPGVYVIGDFG